MSSTTPARGVIRRGRGTALRTVRTTASLAAFALTAGLALVPTLPASAADPAVRPSAGVPTVKTVTLVTGDVVRVSTGADGRRAVSIDPRPDGTVPQAAINEVNGHTYVVPAVAFGLLAAKRLDRDLFDVTGLIAAEYDDASRATLPVMIDYGKGRAAAAEARSASLMSAERTLTVPELGIAAFHADKQDARAFWDDLTKGRDAAGNPTALSDGATRVNLDGRVDVTLEDSVPQIHAPEAWAAGYDGTGVKVAILDTGIDATHPDLVGQIGATKNFTPDATVTDGNGHGTHVASTIAGLGKASAVKRVGVAPGASLMIGKVLADAGYGEDSWVLAGMVWAVDQKADVVSMSLGGDSDDGSNPLAQAVNELSATSDTLFVIAAGNNGFNGPSTVSSPGSADAALTVGAVDVNDAMAGFSSRGPRLNNGALKPEVVAPGVNVTAARASGTDLGGDLDVDPNYTTISGTSMATPHVAGLAAILKQEHPRWGGEQLKDAIANTTVPVANATGFDAGTGRIDALRAIKQDVFAPASLSLGNFAWPYSTLAPTTTPLTYTNDGGSDVVLSLDVAGEDGSPEPTGALSLSTKTLTVPAGGRASVDVITDPTIAAPGAYSAVVTATPDDGGGAVRTGVAYQLEAERYEVSVTIKPRTGSRNVSHLFGLSGFADPWVYEQRTFDASSDEQTATFRLPPGTYATGAISFGVAADGAHEGVVTYEPSFTVSENTHLVLDENQTSLFDYRVDRPVAEEGAVLDVTWEGDAGTTGFTLYGAMDRSYARPSAGLPGKTTVAGTYLLSQPEGVLTPAGSTSVALRTLTAPGGQSSETSVASVKGSYPVVDLGAATSLRPVSVRGAVAVVSGTCDDLTATALTLRQAKAVAMVAYAAPGEKCAGTIEGRVGIPTLQARPFDVERLLSGGSGKATLVTHKNPAYLYDLTKYWATDVPDGGTIDATGSKVAALVETYDGLGTTSADGLKLIEEAIGWVPSRGGAANVLTRRVSFPSTVTHYVSTGAEWERSVRVVDAEGGGEYGQLFSPRRIFNGGSTTRETWFGGPVATRVSPELSLTNGFPPPVREICADPAICATPQDEFFLSMGGFTDAAGHYGNTDIFSNEYSGQIYADGKLILDQWASAYMNTVVPSGKHRFRVVSDAYRENPFWQHSTRIRTAWGFTSDTPTVEQVREVLPMLGVNYLMDLSSTGRAAAGRYDFGVQFVMPNGLKTAPVVKRTVEISWNGGKTWKSAKLTNCAKAACDVRVTNRAGGKATLRVKATDSGGNTVRQLVVNAYEVR